MNKDAGTIESKPPPSGAVSTAVTAGHGISTGFTAGQRRSTRKRSTRKTSQVPELFPASSTATATRSTRRSQPPSGTASQPQPDPQPFSVPRQVSQRQMSLFEEASQRQSALNSAGAIFGLTNDEENEFRRAMSGFIENQGQQQQATIATETEPARATSRIEQATEFNPRDTSLRVSELFRRATSVNADDDALNAAKNSLNVILHEGVAEAEDEGDDDVAEQVSLLEEQESGWHDLESNHNLDPDHSSEEDEQVGLLESGEMKSKKVVLVTSDCDSMSFDGEAEDLDRSKASTVLRWILCHLLVVVVILAILFKFFCRCGTGEEGGRDGGDLPSYNHVTDPYANGGVPVTLPLDKHKGGVLMSTDPYDDTHEDFDLFASDDDTHEDVPVQNLVQQNSYDEVLVDVTGKSDPTPPPTPPPPAQNAALRQQIEAVRAAEGQAVAAAQAPPPPSDDDDTDSDNFDLWGDAEPDKGHTHEEAQRSAEERRKSKPSSEDVSGSGP